MFVIYFTLFMVGFTAADDPIVKLRPNCPSSLSSNPTIHLTADVPAYALARCRNGDKPLTAPDKVNFVVEGSFDQSYIGDGCQFYKKDGSNTYTVDVEVGWGERNSQVVQQQKIHTISCAYDAHGRAVSSTETITDWFLNPWESQHLLGGNASAVFTLQVWDVLDRLITKDLCIGKKIRLAAWDTTATYFGFRALSCLVRNSFGRYSILRAGCGDGLVFDKTDGFLSTPNCVYSPYFDAFKLSGGDNTVEFECVFTVCDGLCNGSSCPTEANSRTKRSAVAGPSTEYIVAKSGPIRLV